MNPATEVWEKVAALMQADMIHQSVIYGIGFLAQIFFSARTSSNANRIFIMPSPHQVSLLTDISPSSASISEMCFSRINSI